MIRRVENNIMNLVLEHDLVANNVKKLNLKLMEYIDEFEDVGEVILDMDVVNNIDSVGVTFVINLYKSVTREGKDFRISHCSEDIKQLFKLMKLEDFFEMDSE